MAKEKTKDEIIEEWWDSLGSYDQVKYLKMYVPRVFSITHSIKSMIYVQVFETEVELKLENPK